LGVQRHDHAPTFLLLTGYEQAGSGAGSARGADAAISQRRCGPADEVGRRGCA
jgi:hypothetical protein